MGAVDVCPERLGAKPDGAVAGYHRSHHRSSSDHPQGAPIKIQYKLNLTGGEWMVYDAVIDDVSVVENYRSQFARILRTSSLEELIENLRAKTSGR
jgi:hypothetical protein